MTYRLLPALCAVALLSIARPALADVSIGASPAFLDLDLEPGKTSAQTILLFNSGKDPVTVKAYAWDWWHDDTNPKKFAPPGTFPHSSAKSVPFVPVNVLVRSCTRRYLSLTLALL